MGNAEPLRVKKTWKESSEESRAKIIDAAFYCFGTIGFNKTTLTDIASQIGASRELPRYHFGSREGLINAMLDKIHSDWNVRYQMVSDSKLKGLDALYELIDLYIQSFNRQPDIFRGRLTLVFQLTDPSNAYIQPKALATQRQLRNLFRDFIKESVVEGVLPDHIDADAAAIIIFGMLRGIAYQWMTDRSEIENKNIPREMKKVIRRILSAK